MSVSVDTMYVATTIYHEARGEPRTCQLYVAETVRNRMDTKQLTAKQVVKEKGQYSWARLIRHKPIKQEYERIQRTANKEDKESLQSATLIAEWVLSPAYVSLSGSEYFHDRSIKTPLHYRGHVMTCGKLVFKRGETNKYALRSLHENTTASKSKK